MNKNYLILILIRYIFTIAKVKISVYINEISGYCKKVINEEISNYNYVKKSMHNSEKIDLKCKEIDIRFNSLKYIYKASS